MVGAVLGWPAGPSSGWAQGKRRALHRPTVRRLLQGKLNLNNNNSSSSSSNNKTTTTTTKIKIRVVEML